MFPWFTLCLSNITPKDDQMLATPETLEKISRPPNTLSESPIRPPSTGERHHRNPRIDVRKCMAIYELQSLHWMRDLWGMISPYIESKIAWQCQEDRQCITMYCNYEILAPYIALYPIDCNVWECIEVRRRWRPWLTITLPLVSESLRLSITTIYYGLLLLHGQSTSRTIQREQMRIEEQR